MVESIIKSISERTYNLPDPTEKQLKLMVTCDTCKHRKPFNIDYGNENISRTNWCDEIYSYVKLNTIYLMCPFNILHLKKKSLIKRILGW